MAVKDSVGAEWIRLQQRLADRTSQYLESIGQLVGEGSLEAREYVERSTKFWGDLVGELGDWLRDADSGVRKPKPGGTQKGPPGPAPEPIPLKVSKRVDSRPAIVEVPVELFEKPDDLFRLSIDGFTRRAKKNEPRRPIQSETHFRLEPDEVTISQRGKVELKTYDLPDNLVSGDVYDGTLWAAPVTKGEVGPRQFVAAIELTVV